MSLHFIAFSSVGVHNITTLLLKRNCAFCPGGGDFGYYLAVSSLTNRTLVVYDSVIHGYVPFTYEWVCDARKKLMTHCHSNMCLAVNERDWSLSLEAFGRKNQEFIYNASSNELFWKNPFTKRLHVIYIRCSTIFGSKMGGKHKCLVANNDMDRIESFQLISTINQKQRSWKIYIAYSLCKSNQTRDLSAETIQNWMVIIESFSFNNVTFGLFKTETGGYLIGDGHVLTIADANKFEKSQHQYYGLWRITRSRGHLVHYLSGNYVPILTDFQFFDSSLSTLI